MIGKVIGNYQVVTELARGGMGTVYRGHHLNLPREVAIKAITLSAFEPRAQEHLKARFLREAYIQSQLDHPNIVRVYEFFAAAENYYLIMEFVAGMSLHDLIERQGALPPTQAVSLFKQALAAMDYAHNFSYVDEVGQKHTGIIHRDIKPANMLLDGLARLKIADFGIVKVTGESGLTQSGFNPGTVAYMSPEQLRGFELDVRSDIYSLGVMFYQMLSGRLPFQSSSTGSDYDIRKGHIELEPPPLTDLRPEIPAELSKIVARSLRKDPAERFQTATEFLGAILLYESHADTAEQVAPKLMAGMAGMTGQMKAAPTGPPPRTRTSETTAARAVPAPAATASSVVPSQIRPRVSVPVSALRNKVEPERSRSPLAIGAVLGLLAVIGIGAFLWTRQPSASSIASNNPAPFTQPTQVIQQVPSSQLTNTGAPSNPSNAAAQNSSLPANSTTPVLSADGARLATQETAPGKAASETPIESEALKNARDYEQQERYSEAIDSYDQYVRMNPRATNVSAVSDRIGQLKNLKGHLTDAREAMEQQDYGKAEQEYKMVLALKPESQAALHGLQDVKARAALHTADTAPNMRPPDGQREGMRPGPLGPYGPQGPPVPPGQMGAPANRPMPLPTRKF